MKLFGHPVHVMLVHFPVALWPAHFALHAVHSHLPAGVASVAGFWLLAAGTLVGWLAMIAGSSDLLGLQRTRETAHVTAALLHGLVNGTVLLGFTGLLAAEYARYPDIRHGPGLLGFELALLLVLAVGNYLGGRLIWKAD